MQLFNIYVDKRFETDMLTTETSLEETPDTFEQCLQAAIDQYLLGIHLNKEKQHDTNNC